MLPFDDFWPVVAILLLAALVGLGAWWYVSANETKTVPSLTSRPLQRALAEVQDAGLKAAIVSESDASPPGTVFEQRPAAGAELEEGSTVTLVVSKGRRW